MRRRSTLASATATAAAVLLASCAFESAPTFEATGAAAPVVVGAGPIADPSDTVGGGFRRVTFSPDGDGRNDVVTIRVRAHAGDRLALVVAPDSKGPLPPLTAGTAAAGTTTVRWSGLQTGGVRYPTGSYVLRVCDTTVHLCTAQRVLAHLRILSVYAPLATGVSAGEDVRVRVATDRAGPYRLELVSAADASGQGIGAVDVARPGWVDYRIPDVPKGGVWLLRLLSGNQATHFPLVVHEPGWRLDDPPHGGALVVYPWLTWRAYDMADENRDGQVDSWYSHPLDPVVPLYGPFEPPARDPLLEGREPNPDSQAAFARWLDAHRLRAQHVTDVELGQLPEDVLRRYAAVVFEGHTEYYELGTYGKLLRYRDAGGRLYFLQGNSFYGEARIRGSSVVRLSYRYRTAARSDFALAVTGFQSCCWPRSIRPVYHLAPGAVQALPWAFAGTGLKDGDEFGVAAGEVDTTSRTLSPPGTVVLATATVPAYKPAGGAREYGWIGTRKIPYEPSWLRPRSIAIAYAATGNGEVFSWADTGFMETIDSDTWKLPPAERAALDRVALNVWEHFTR